MGVVACRTSSAAGATSFHREEASSLEEGTVLVVASNRAVAVRQADVECAVAVQASSVVQSGLAPEEWMHLTRSQGQTGAAAAAAGS